MSETQTMESMIGGEYKYGFTTDVEYEDFPKGINKDIIREISRRKEEPKWMLEFRLDAFEKWQKMEEPDWANIEYPRPDFQDIQYYSAPKNKNDKDKPQSLDDVDPEIRQTYEKLGIPLEEQKMLAGVAVDAVFDSVSIFTTFKEKLAEAGVIFCSISEAVQDYPELVKEYMGSVVPKGDNFYAALNSAVFSDGSFCYVPKDTVCPMELSTYFRINNMQSGQFERTLIICEDNSHVSYLEGCTAPQFSKTQMHAAVVELIAKENSEIKYSTIQNWYSGDEDGNGGIYNFVTKRGHCRGDNSKISWTQVETGSAITWKYPSVILQGDDSIGEFFSVAVTNGRQQADTGTKMIHIGNNTKSTIISKGISAGKSNNSYRGLVKISPRADNAQNYSVCDSMLIGQTCGAHTFPYIESANATSKVEHEASTSRIGEDQIFYLQQRGMDEDDAISMVVNGFAKEVLKELPMEFAVEADKLLGIKLEGSVG